MGRYLVFALAAFTISAFAQQKELLSAPSPNVQPHVQLYRAFDFQENAAPSSLRHFWYWEVPAFSPRLPETNRFLPRGAKVGNPDFEPASLRWSFTGKRKVVPLIDLTVLQIKPGEKLKPSGESAASGTAQTAPGILWTKATHSISELLHY